jgi:hypothetical protein
MDKSIHYYSKEIYGQKLFYLARLPDRTHWRELTGKKTITEWDMQNLTAMTGVTFERVFEPEEEK